MTANTLITDSLRCDRRTWPTSPLRKLHQSGWSMSQQSTPHNAISFSGDACLVCVWPSTEGCTSLPKYWNRHCIFANISLIFIRLNRNYNTLNGCYVFRLLTLYLAFIIFLLRLNHHLALRFSTMALWQQKKKLKNCCQVTEVDEL